MSDSASKAKGLAWIVATCLLGMLFACGLSPLAHLVPFSWEKYFSYAIGADFPHPGCRANPQAKALLDRLLKRLYPVYPEDADFTVEVHIVRSGDINAFAELGGRISVYTGLLDQAESPEELAGILAHEMEHVHRRHIMEGVITHIFTAQGISTIFSGDTSSAADWANYFLTMTFTRSQEEQADEGGLKRLQQAHVDNRGFRQFFARMEKTESADAFLSDHPASADRLKMAEGFDNHDTKPIMTADEWKILKEYCNE